MASTKIGSLYYISPEALKAGKSASYDFKTDMWSFGCMVYEFVMDRTPFEVSADKDTLFLVAERIQNSNE